MAQFQVYRNPRASRSEIPFLLDVQSDHVEIGTRLVAPLVRQPLFGARLSHINPEFEIAGEPVVMSAGDLAAVSVRELREHVADLSHARGAILGAIDFLITGY